MGGTTPPWQPVSSHLGEGGGVISPSLHWPTGIQPILLPPSPCNLPSVLFSHATLAAYAKQAWPALSQQQHGNQTVPNHSGSNKHGSNINSNGSGNMGGATKLVLTLQWARYH